MKTSFTFCLLFTLSCITSAQIKVPEKIMGNWINEQSNEWQYGFFENFVVYDADFWDYQAVNQKQGGIEIKLRKGRAVQTLQLTLPLTDSFITVAQNGQRPCHISGRRE